MAIRPAKKHIASRPNPSNSRSQTGEDKGAAVLLCSAHSGGSSMKAIVTILGVVLLIVAAMYFLVPADSLPTFLPGHETGLMRIRAKHGMLAGGLGVVLLAASWFLGRR
jgi:hypothetical protein